MLHPARVLRRGYGMLEDAQGQLLRSVQQVNPGNLLRVILADGELQTRVESVGKGGT